MKTNFKYVFLMAAALVLGFSSCSNDDADNNDGAELQTLVIKLPNDVVLGRAVEDLVENLAQTATINNINVYMLNASNTVVKIDVFTNEQITDRKKRIEDVSASVNKVILLANVPTGVILPTVGASADDVRNYAFTIASQNNSSGITLKTLIGEGTPATAVDPNPDGHNYKSVSIDLAALTARMEIGTVAAGTGIASIKLEGVWINSFYASGAKVPANIVYYNSTPAPINYWATTPLTSTSPSANDFTDVTIDNAYSHPEYYNKAENNSVFLWDAANPPTPASMVYAYHVFAGSNIPHLIMLVSGEYEIGYYTGTDKYFLGWVTFTKFLEGGTAISEMLGNCIYRIGTDGNGIKIIPEIITPDPEMDFDLGVKVEITPWTEKTVTPSV